MVSLVLVTFFMPIEILLGKSNHVFISEKQKNHPHLEYAILKKPLFKLNKLVLHLVFGCQRLTLAAKDSMSSICTC